jgi:hypothetical protein
MSISHGHTPRTFSPYPVPPRCAASSILFVKDRYDGTPFYCVKQYCLIIIPMLSPHTIVLGLYMITQTVRIKVKDPEIEDHRRIDVGY